MTIASSPQAVITLEPKNLKRWTVQDYHRISELGILIDDRTELIDGQITIMAAKGTSHVTSLHLLAHALRDRLGNLALVRTQDPIHLDDFSEPEPDLAIVQGTILDYVEQHPRPEQIYLVVEVADSTLKQDHEIKDKLYARTGIADYWLLAPQKRQLHIFRKPTSTSYTEHLILTEPNQASPLAFPDCAIALTSILPPI
ncbi:MAG: Uma2 family endonuclease [Pseudanabaenaceae cyanobacterium]|jgi:Uma2 family endonuclease